MNMIASSGQLRASYIRSALVLVPLIILLGILTSKISGSSETSPWLMALDKPEIYPPGWIFGVVWTVLYALMGFSAALVVTAHGAWDRGIALVAFVVQLLLNLAWPIVFFGMHQITWSFFLIVVLDLAVVLTVLLFWRVRKLAAILLLPYLAWVLFATYLTYEIHTLNPDLDGRDVSGAVQRYEF